MTDHCEEALRFLKNAHDHLTRIDGKALTPLEVDYHTRIHRNTIAIAQVHATLAAVQPPKRVPVIVTAPADLIARLQECVVTGDEGRGILFIPSEIADEMGFENGAGFAQRLIEMMQTPIAEETME